MKNILASIAGLLPGM